VSRLHVELDANDEPVVRVLDASGKPCFEPGITLANFNVSMLELPERGSSWLSRLDLTLKVIELRRAAPSCAELRRAAPSCAELRRAAPSCAELRRAAPSCAELRPRRGNLHFAKFDAKRP